MFSQALESSHSDHKQSPRYREVKRGLVLLLVIAASVVAASWLLSLPLYFDLEIASQVLPFIIASAFLALLSKVSHPLIYKLAIPASYVIAFSSWSFVLYINSKIQEQAVNSIEAAQLLGMSNSAYLLGLVFLTFWLARYFKYAIYLSSVSIIILLSLLSVFSPIQLSFLIAILLLLISGSVIASLSYRLKTAAASAANSADAAAESDLLSMDDGEADIVAELAINTEPLDEARVEVRWDKILRHLQTKLKDISDVDQLFKRSLSFLHENLSFDSAAVGMLQDKTLKKIASYGDIQYLHSEPLCWTGQRIKELFASAKPKVSKQQFSGGAGNETLYRVDIPVISSRKAVGIVSLFRTQIGFDNQDVQLANSTIFHSMIALKISRLKDEVKRLSSESKNTRMTLYSREQFVTQVKPVFEKLGKPRECSLFIVELDELDKIVDTMGREAGNFLFKAVSKAIASQLESHDLLGAYGKEGFIVLLDETNLMHAQEIAENIRKKVEELKVKYKDSALNTTVSIGLTIVSSPDEDLQGLMRKADMGLFIAKENGCNTVKVSL